MNPCWLPQKTTLHGVAFPIPLSRSPFFPPPKISISSFKPYRASQVARQPRQPSLYRVNDRRVLPCRSWYRKAARVSFMQALKRWAVSVCREASFFVLYVLLFPSCTDYVEATTPQQTVSISTYANPLLVRISSFDRDIHWPSLVHSLVAIKPIHP